MTLLVTIAGCFGLVAIAHYLFPPAHIGQSKRPETRDEAVLRELRQIMDEAARKEQEGDR